jgi:hypothetical protein
VVAIQIRYARSGDLYIAYEVIGEASLDLLYVTNYDSTPTLDNWTAEPVVARWVERFASFSRLILMDVRGRRWSGRAGLRGRRKDPGGIGSNLSAAEVFDPATAEWTPLPDMPTPRGGTAAAATEGGYVVSAGGKATTGTFDEAEAFDVEAARWISLPPLPTARHGVGVVALGDIVYVVTGDGSRGTFSDVLEAIDLEQMGTRRPIRHRLPSEPPREVAMESEDASRVGDHLPQVGARARLVSDAADLVARSDVSDDGVVTSAAGDPDAENLTLVWIADCIAGDRDTPC